MADKRKFSELADKMAPESRTRAEAKATMVGLVRDIQTTNSPSITVYAADSPYPSVARDVSLKAELQSGMAVKLTLTGENYAVTAWVSRESWDDMVREMA